jgi:hypothetical protein
MDLLGVAQRAGPDADNFVLPNWLVDERYVAGPLLQVADVAPEALAGTIVDGDSYRGAARDVVVAGHHPNSNIAKRLIV